MPDTNKTSGFGQFLAEMRRRHVVRFALGYAAAAFVILQLAEILFPAFGIGEGGLRVLVIITTLGFPPALVLAWVYDLTRDGIHRTDGGIGGPLFHRLALGTLLVITVVSTGGLGWYLAQQDIFDTTQLSNGVLSGPTSATEDDAITLATYDPNEPIRSLAVLPLDDYSEGGDQAYFTASMHEELIAKLSRLNDIRVVSRTSVMRYAGTILSMPEIGQALNADVVIEGSVTRTTDRTRVTLQIIHARSDSHIETLQWDSAGVTDILAFQTEIAHEVVEEIAAQHDESIFLQAVASVDPEAQDAYFRGRYEYERGTPQGYRTAIGMFEDALDADPDFVPALVGMAGARFLIGLEEEDVSEEDLAQAHDEALAAVELDAESVEAREVLALIERSMPDLMGSDQMIPAPDGVKQVHIVRMPNGMDSVEVDITAFDTAWVAAVTGLGERIEERVRRWSGDMERGGSGAWDPSRAAFQARRYLGSGRYEEASEVLTRIVQDSPEFGPGWEMLVRTQIVTGDVDAATRTVQAWSDSGASGAPDESEVSELGLAVETNGTRGYWNWTAERLKVLDAGGNRVPRMELANAHAALGNADEAFNYLTEALERGEPGVPGIRSDPAWDDLRSDPRYREIGQQAQSMRFSPGRR